MALHHRAQDDADASIQINPPRALPPLSRAAVSATESVPTPRE